MFNATDIVQQGIVGTTVAFDVSSPYPSPTIPCPVCHLLFPNHSALTVHRRRHLETLIYPCKVSVTTRRPIIHFQFTLFPSLLNHLRYFVCFFSRNCKKSYANRSGLAHHMRSFHRMTSRAERDALIVKVDPQEASQIAIANGISSANGDDDSDDDSRESYSDRDSEDDKPLGTSKSASPVIKDDHIEREPHPSLTLTTYPSSIKPLSALPAHPAPDADRLFKCQYCNKSFNDKSHYTIHLRLHTGDCPYPCPYQGCIQRFMTAAEKTVHMRAAHEADPKPHKCHIEGCREEFRFYVAYREHMKIKHNIQLPGKQNRRKPGEIFYNNNSTPATPLSASIRSSPTKSAITSKAFVDESISLELMKRLLNFSLTRPSTLSDIHLPISFDTFILPPFLSALASQPNFFLPLVIPTTLPIFPSAQFVKEVQFAAIEVSQQSNAKVPLYSYYNTTSLNPYFSSIVPFYIHAELLPPSKRKRIAVANALGSAFTPNNIDNPGMNRRMRLRLEEEARQEAAASGGSPSGAGAFTSIPSPLQTEPHVYTVCEYCGRLFTFAHQMKSHTPIHTEPPLRCPIDDCKTTYYLKPNMRTHMNRTHKITNKIKIAELEKYAEEKKEEESKDEKWTTMTPQKWKEYEEIRMKKEKEEKEIELLAKQAVKEENHEEEEDEGGVKEDNTETSTQTHTRNEVDDTTEEARSNKRIKREDSASYPTSPRPQSPTPLPALHNSTLTSIPDNPSNNMNTDVIDSGDTIPNSVVRLHMNGSSRHLNGTKSYELVSTYSFRPPSPLPLHHDQCNNSGNSIIIMKSKALNGNNDGYMISLSPSAKLEK